MALNKCFLLCLINDSDASVFIFTEISSLSLTKKSSNNFQTETQNLLPKYNRITHRLAELRPGTVPGFVHPTLPSPHPLSTLQMRAEVWREQEVRSGVLTVELGFRCIARFPGLYVCAAYSVFVMNIYHSFMETCQKHF